MSRQPSTIDDLRSTAAEATHTVAETLDPSGEQKAPVWRQNETLEGVQKALSKDVSYKEQLDEAATSRPGKSGNGGSIVDKVASFIPGAAKVQSAIQGKQEVTTNGEKMEGDKEPPTRPENDVQVEEFLKEQYRSYSKSNSQLKPSDGRE